MKKSRISLTQGLLTLLKLWFIGLCFSVSILGDDFDLALEFEAAPEPDWAVGVASLLAENFVTIRQYGLDGKLTGTGSGVVVGRGLVATCLHAITNARRIEVQFSDSQIFEPLEIVNRDESSDLAILRIPESALTGGGLAIQESAPLPGTAIAAMGNPGGDSAFIVTGVVAAFQRDIEGWPVIPLAVSIEQGNSGGPVVDSSGELIGIVSLKDLRRPGLGYAVPASELSELLKTSSPVPYQEWIKRGQLPEAIWIPDQVDDWSGQGGRILFDSEERASYGGLRICSAVDHEIKVNTISLEVLNLPSVEAGIAFFNFDKSESIVWVVEGGESVTLNHIRGGSEAPRQLLTIPLEPSLRFEPWMRLKVSVNSNMIQCFLNGRYRGVAELPESFGRDSLSGAGMCVTAGLRAGFRSFACWEMPSVTVADADSCFESVPPLAAELNRGNEEAGLLRRKTIGQIKLIEAKLGALKDKARRQHIDAAQTSICEALTLFDAGSSDLALTRVGLLFASLNDSNLDDRVYCYQATRLIAEVKSELSAVTNPSPETIARAIQAVAFERWGFVTCHEDGDLTGDRLPEDPRRIFEDRRAAVFATQALITDLMRACGLPRATATGAPGMVLCDPDVPYEEMLILHTCNGELIDFSAQEAEKCAGFRTRVPSQKVVVATLTDQQFLGVWLSIQKNQVTERDWPQKIIPYLETLVKINPNDVSSKAELALFHMGENRSDLNQVAELTNIIRAGPNNIDRTRIMRILRFIGIDVGKILAEFAKKQNQESGDSAASMVGSKPLNDKTVED